MPFRLHKFAWALSLFILLSGSILQLVLGTSGGQPPQVRGVDDAYISYRYARNIAHFKGAVFNSGERVEGYSNFLYVLLMVPGFFVTGNDGIFLYSAAWNLLFSVGSLWLFRKHLREKLGEREAALGSLLLALCLPLWAAAASGLETSLVLLVNLAIWMEVEHEAERPQPRGLSPLSVLLILSLLVRADGFIVPALAVFYLLMKRGVRAAATTAVPVVLAMVAYEGWRYHYYGYLLPNTYYLKIAGGLGSRMGFAAERLFSLSIHDGLFAYLLVLILAMVQVVIRKGRDGKALGFAGWLGLGWLGYWFYIGGDNLGDRFLLIFFPLGIFALLRALQSPANWRPALLRVGLVLFLQVAAPLASDGRFRYSTDRYDAWITLGKFLAREYAHQSVATGAVGKVPFFSEAATSDMLGVVDPVIAHEPVAAGYFFPGHIKFDADYTLSRKPDLLAGWVQPDGDLIYGFTRKKYQAAGYRLRHLLFTGRHAPAESIIDASSLSDADLERLVKAGYQYAALSRH